MKEKIDSEPIRTLLKVNAYILHHRKKCQRKSWLNPTFPMAFYNLLGHSSAFSIRSTIYAHRAYSSCILFISKAKIQSFIRIPSSCRRVHPLYHDRLPFLIPAIRTSLFKNHLPYLLRILQIPFLHFFHIPF